MKLKITNPVTLSALTIWAALALILSVAQPAQASLIDLASSAEFENRMGHTATLLTNVSGVVLVTGGTNNSGTFLSSAVVYDRANNTWTPAPAMSTARFGHTATLLKDGTVLVTGGRISESDVSDSVQVYNPGNSPGNGSWTPGPPMAAKRFGHTATLLADGKVLVAGGFINTADGVTASAEVYNPITRAWTPTANNMTVGRAFHTATFLSSSINNSPLPDNVLVAGGFTSDGNPTATAERFDPFNGPNGRWTATASMRTKRAFQTATLRVFSLSSRDVIVTGGKSDGGLATASVESFNPNIVGGAWTELPSMSSPRFGHTAARLPFGPFNYDGAPPDHELRIIGGTVGAISFHRATVLPSAEILVTGGSGVGASITAQLDNPFRSGQGQKDYFDWSYDFDLTPRESPFPMPSPGDLRFGHGNFGFRKMAGGNGFRLGLMYPDNGGAQGMVYSWFYNGDGSTFTDNICGASVQRNENGVWADFLPEDGGNNSQDVKDIAAGPCHALVLLRDSTMRRVGRNFDGTLFDSSQPVIDHALIANVKAIAAANNNNLALLENNTVHAFGRFRDPVSGAFGGIIVPSELTRAATANVQSIACGGEHQLALLAAGTVVAWGKNPSGQTTVPSQIGNVSDGAFIGVKSVSAGQVHSLALQNDGTVVAWGGGAVVPDILKDPASAKVVKIEAGNGMNIALQVAGTIVVWDNQGRIIPAPGNPAGIDGIFQNVFATHNPPTFAALYSDVGSPILHAQASEQRVGANGTVKISAGVSGKALSYQWQYNGVDIDGATNSMLTLNAGAANAGRYTVIVNNTHGTITTAPILVGKPIPAGTYNGLFYEGEAVRHSSSGFFSFNLGINGAFSGSMKIDGGSYPLAGKFNSGHFVETNVVRIGKSTLKVTLQLLTANGKNQVIGTVSDEVSDEPWEAPLSGEMAYYKTLLTAPQAGKYSMTLLGNSNGDTSPGYGTKGVVTVTTAGGVKLGGSLCDDAGLSQSTVYLSKTGEWPLYANLYKGTGSVLGWLTFTNKPTYKLTGNVSWIKTGSNGVYYSKGFTNEMTVYGSRLSP